MKRILINATQNEEIRVALCTGNHLYDFDLENRTREQKKSNIYKGHVTRVEPSLEAVFVEYGSQRQGFLPIREISAEYLKGNPRDENIKKLIKEGDELIVQVEKEERGNKGAALSTYVSLAGRYLVLMPNNPRGGGISRQISGKLREDMKRMLGQLDLAKGMSVIIRTAGIGKTQEDLQHDLNHLLNIWQAIQEQNQKYPSPRLVHQEAGVVTRAVRDYLRDDIAEIWIDNENAYIEAAGFIDAVMPKQAEKLRKYTDYEPMFSRFNIEKQIETAYQREVRLPSGGSIVIDQTEALVSIDINSAKSTKGSDVAETAYHTNLEAADEIARQLRLRDMGGLIVIDFIDMNDNKHQKEVEKRLIDATKYDRARVQFGDISKFGLMEMSRQRLRPSLEESTGYICPRCHGNGMIRDLRSLSLSIMRQIEQIALKERQGEVQAEVPTDIAAFLLNEKRDSLVYLEQDSGTRITILPHAHLESPNFKLHFNRDGFAPSSYERITDTAQENSDLGYTVDWQTSDSARPEQQPTRQPLKPSGSDSRSNNQDNGQQTSTVSHSNEHRNHSKHSSQNNSAAVPAQSNTPQNHANSAVQNPVITPATAAQPKAVAWLSNLFAQAPQAQTTPSVSSHDAADAIERLVNTGATSLGSFGQVDNSALANTQNLSVSQDDQQSSQQSSEPTSASQGTSQAGVRENDSDDDRRRRKSRKSRSTKPRQRKESHSDNEIDNKVAGASDAKSDDQDKSNDSQRHSDSSNSLQDSNRQDRPATDTDEQARAKRKPHSQRGSRGTLERNKSLTITTAKPDEPLSSSARATASHQISNEVVLQINEAPVKLKSPEIVHLSLDDSKATQVVAKSAETSDKTDTVANTETQAKIVVDNAIESNTTNSDKASSPSNELTVEEKLTSDSVTDVDTSADNKALSVIGTDTLATAQASVDTADVSNSTDASDSTDVVAAEKQSITADAVNKEATPPETKSEVPTSNSVVELTHEALFAKRYVAADKFGQASNDPRLVRAQQSLPQVTEQTPISKPTIRGTVGEFIHTMLADAQARLADDGVINCFIAAIAEHKQQASAPSAIADNSGFDFSNYGYQPLTADYLAQFATMTQAVSQFAANQGKTQVTPSAIGQRASNDPRGQHPDYQQAKLDESVTVNSVEDDNVENDNAATLEEVDAHKIAATALTSAGQADDVTTDSEHLLEPEAHKEPTDIDSDASALVSIQADSSLATGDFLQADSSLQESEQLGKEDSQSSKSKTTIASYKNMIENVAEQLLPQTGMFSLTTPKVPKARARKPKAEHKKPTQAEKVEADDTDS